MIQRCSLSICGEPGNSLDATAPAAVTHPVETHHLKYRRLERSSLVWALVFLPKFISHKDHWPHLCTFCGQNVVDFLEICWASSPLSQLRKLIQNGGAPGGWEFEPGGTDLAPVERFPSHGNPGSFGSKNIQPGLGSKRWVTKWRSSAFKGQWLCVFGWSKWDNRI